MADSSDRFFPRKDPVLPLYCWQRCRGTDFQGEYLMSRWVRVAAAADCPPGSSLEAVAEDRLVALFNVGGTFHALDGVCPHQGGPLGKGQLCGAVVTCPWHGWQFDVASGCHQLRPSLVQPGFPVRVEGGAVFVDVETSA